MRKHTCIHAGVLCTLYAQSKACAGGLYVDHPGCCSVAQVGSCCLSLSCLTTVCCCPQICSNASCFSLGTDLRGIRRIVFLLAMAPLALSPPPGTEVEAQPRPPEKCNPCLRWQTALTIALLRAAETCFDETRRRGPEGRLRARMRANRWFRHRAPIMIEGGNPNQMVFNWERGHGGCWSEGSEGGFGEGGMVSITANAMIMTRRPTNVTETNQYPAFVA